MNQPEKFPPPFRLGPWLVQPDLNRVLGPDGPVQIEPRVMKVLLCLAETPGTVLTRLQLLDLVWGDSVVGEEILTRAISELRRVFGDQARQPEYIETIRNHGYRLIAPVTPAVTEPEPEPAPAQPIPAEETALPHPPGGNFSEPAPEKAARRRAVWPLAVAIVAIVAILGVMAAWGPHFWKNGQLQPDNSPVILGATAVPLTSYPGREWHPALSPDGTQVAFIWRGVDGDNSDVYLKQRGSETTLRLTDDPGWAAWPAWSPDGQTIAFVGAEDGRAAVCLVPSLGGPVRRLQEVASYVDGLDWSPDGQHLVWSALDTDTGEYRLFQLSLSDLSLGKLPGALDDQAGDFQPRYSPDGSQLAWMALDLGGASHLYVRPLRGTDARQVSVGLTGVQGLAWTADGSSLVYAASQGGAFSLWQVPVSGSLPGVASWIATPGDFAWNPTIARRTGDLAYEQVRVDQDLWRIKVISRDPWQLETAPFAQSTRWEYEARYSPDGRQVIFVSARTGTPEIWLADPDGKGLQQLTRLQGAGITNLRWHPDGRQIAFNAIEGGLTVIMVGASNGAAPRTLTTEGRQEIFTGWSADGQSILFASEGTEGWNIFRRDSASGASVPVTRGGGLTAQESSDGHFLFFTRPGRAGLWRAVLEDGSVPVEGPEPELVIPELAGQDRGNWVVYGDRVLWVLRSGGSALLAEWDLATGLSSFITEIPRISGSGLSISPDGGAIIYARTGEMSGDLMLIPAETSP